MAKARTGLDPKLETALNRQVNHELAAAYNYLAMSAWFDERNLNGFARWMQQQRAEELEHAMRLYQYLLDRGGHVELEAVAKPRSDYKDVHEVFVAALDLEKQNTAAIYELYALARELSDYATQSHLQWFLSEQVEEEKIFDEVLSWVEMAADDRSALLLLDDRLNRRGGDEAGGGG